MCAWTIPPSLLVLLAQRRERFNHFANIVLHLRRAGTGQSGKVSKTVNSRAALLAREVAER
jgi:hypothetical protein